MRADRRVSVARVIDARPEDVFAVLVDPAGHVAIDGSGMIKGKRFGDAPLRLGSKFGMQMKQLGVSYRISNTVVEYDENRRIAWEHFNRHRWRYELEPVDSGTKVTETFDWTTAMIPTAIELMGYPKSNIAAMEATLERLDNHLASRKPDPKLYNAIKDRGTAYLMVFRELEGRYGADEAISVMRSASRAHGLFLGQSLRCFAPRDFAGMARGFFLVPDEVIFAPDIKQLDETGLEVHMMSCPIKDAWADAGCSDEEICALLYCASALDEATLESAGFEYELKLWEPGKSGCCHTRITEAPQSKSSQGD